MAEHKTRFREDEYNKDLNPNFRAGESDLPGPESNRTAYDIKALHEKWPGFSDRILKQIPVLDTGARLQEGAIYLDLMQPERGPFIGMNDQVVGPECHLVAKEDVDYELWNALVGEQDNYRLGRFAPNVQPERTTY